ncbi:caspase family protein [Streptomyces avermitilis]|uniref:caspase family protein n=1 Tax=Streptomyces avermitilis TaxID=33903 RepID=UPI0036CC5FE0
MGTIHALLVGIDDYPPQTATPLGGAVTDVEEAARLVTELVGEQADLLFLRDGEATVAAVEDAVVRRLGAAGPGDTALLWFSGHGTQQRATGADLLIEATGRNQALVCVDGPLLDKRLGALLERVAEGGAHVVAVLDCCYAGGATRAGELTPRFAPPSPDWDWDWGGAGGGDGSGDFGADERARGVVAAAGSGTPAPTRHVLLAASRLDQQSFEGHFGGRRMGAFTYALLGAVREAGPGLGYRELLAAADARLRRSGGRQQPVLYPVTPGGPADQPFLGGAAGRPSPHLLRFGADGWEVDCGSGHGLRDGAGAEGTEFTVVDGELVGPVMRARDVRTERTLVDPVEWVPAREQVYPVTLSALALPAAGVALLGPARSDEVRALERAIASAGPGGGPSPLLRLVGSPQEAADLHFRVEVRAGLAHVLGRDGTPFVDPLPLTDPAAHVRRIADCLVHLTRWHQLRDLTPRPSLLDGLVRMEIAPWNAAPGQALTPDGSGQITVPYTAGAAGPEAPWLSIRLHNRSPDRKLWCLLLDLTDSYEADSALYRGHFIGPGHTGYALDGHPVQLSLPRTRAVVPGAAARDWLKLIVAEGELNTVPFQLPAWDPYAVVARDRTPGDGVLRFTGPGHAADGSRDLGPAYGAAAGRWTTVTVPLRTVVPGGAALPGPGAFTGPGG